MGLKFIYSVKYTNYFTPNRTMTTINNFVNIEVIERIHFERIYFFRVKYNNTMGTLKLRRYLVCDIVCVANTF